MSCLNSSVTCIAFGDHGVKGLIVAMPERRIKRHKTHKTHITACLAEEIRLYDTAAFAASRYEWLRANLQSVSETKGPCKIPETRSPISH